MRIDHIGYAVKSIEKSMEQFKKIGYVFGNLIADEKRNIYICFGMLDNYRIELISPLNKKKWSPVDNYIKRIGNTPYHVCYKIANLEETIRDLKENGYIETAPPEEACAFGSKRVAFLFHARVGIIEVVEE